MDKLKFAKTTCEQSTKNVVNLKLNAYLKRSVRHDIRTSDAYMTYSVHQNFKIFSKTPSALEKTPIFSENGAALSVHKGLALKGVNHLNLPAWRGMGTMQILKSRRGLLAEGRLGELQLYCTYRNFLLIVDATHLQE